MMYHHGALNCELIVVKKILTAKETPFDTGIIPVFRTVPNHRSEGLSSWARFQHNFKPNATRSF
jgi:hypothetical protein